MITSKGNLALALLLLSSCAEVGDGETNGGGINNENSPATISLDDSPFKRVGKDWHQVKQDCEKLYGKDNSLFEGCMRAAPHDGDWGRPPEEN